MEYRTEVINGNCVKKNDFTVMYNTLLKMDRKWAHNHYLMVKCSKMLVKSSSNGAVPNLNDICHWISKYVGVVVDVYEVRSLIRYVHIILYEKSSRELGYCDMTPPAARNYDAWCANLFMLAQRNVSSAKEKQSQVFQQQLEKLTMLNSVTDSKKMATKKKKKKKRANRAAGRGVVHHQNQSQSRSHAQLPSIVSMFPSPDEDEAADSIGESERSPSGRKAGGKVPSMVKGATTTCTELTPLDPVLTSLTKQNSFTQKQSPQPQPELVPLPFNKYNSPYPNFENLTQAVVKTQVKKHTDRNKKKLLATQFPDLVSPKSIDYAIAPVNRSSDSSEVKDPSIMRARSFNDQVDEAFFGPPKPSNQYVDHNGLLQQSSVSKLVKERRRFRQESEKMKNEVFATLGL
mmetsp:Transcript_17199/g.28782  ORF Transcript_17199/g.28782 Transcript_17199/m.28782 type:complete len:403 (-) Transcript_17199:339-1547(-)